MQEINASISYDKTLYRQDIAGSIAHAKMLADQKILTLDDRDQIISGLRQIEKEIAAGTFIFSEQLEDIHMNIETRLAELIGDPAKRLHTARSRNDQVATDLRLWLREAITDIDRMLAVPSFADQAEDHAETLMPGYTHLQTAQPITLAFTCWLMCRCLTRPCRFADCIKRITNHTWCGSPRRYMHLTGIKQLLYWALTGLWLMLWTLFLPVILPLNSCLASICATHLSRLAEEIVIWSTDRFAFVSLSDAYTTGSSIMPKTQP